MAVQFSCNICGKMQKHDESAAEWFTFAVIHGGKGFRTWGWPTGSRLQEPHDSLEHICGVEHLLATVNQWATKREWQRREETLLKMAAECAE